MIEKAGDAAMVGGAVIATGSGSALIFGLTPAQWSVIGVIGGLLVGVVGLAINAWFKWQHLKLAIAEADKYED